jgi:AbrB family looped-hinge helix DNA binding protein
MLDLDMLPVELAMRNRHKNGTMSRALTKTCLTPYFTGITSYVIHYGGDVMTSRITSKGQVTIPKEVRDELGLTPGTKIGFKKIGDKYVLVKEVEAAEDDYLAEWIGKVEPLEVGQTVDEMINDMRGGRSGDRR